MKKKKKLKLRWGRIAAALTVLAAIVVAVYFLIVGIISLCKSLFGNDEADEADIKSQIELTPEMLRCDTIMSQRIDSLMNIPQRLDTADIAVSVFDATTQQSVYNRHGSKSLAPASCMKLLTAVSAIKTLGMDYKFNESLQVRGEMHRDTLVGTLLLVADDDPMLLDFDTLIVAMQKRGIRHVRGNVILNLAREDTLKAHPTAKIWDIPYHKTPLLLRGRKYVERVFLASLRAKGVTIKKDATVNSANAKGALGGIRYHYVARMSHSLRSVITPMLIHSSNIKADALFYHLDWKAKLCPDRRMHWEAPHFMEAFTRQQFVNNDSLTSSYVIRDGSGLSPENRLTADFLVQLLRYAYDDTAIRDYFINEALATPAAGPRCGSLMTRMCRPEFKGRVFVKTGTLTTIGTSSLSGYIIGNDGHWYIFSIINSNSPVAESRIFQDRFCKVLRLY